MRSADEISVLPAPLRKHSDAQQTWRDEGEFMPAMPTTCHRLRSYPSPIGPASQAVQDSLSYLRRCSLRRLRCAASDGCREDFDHTFAVAVDAHWTAAAGHFPADYRRSAIHSTFQAVLAAAAVAAAVAAGLVSLVHRSHV